MEIRSTTKNDDPFKLSSIFEKSWKHAYKGIISQEYLNSITAGQWIDHLKQKDRNNLVLTEQEKIIGIASFGKSRWNKYSDFGEVMSIYLLPEYIRKGYGKLLLAGCIEVLRQAGYTMILLWVLEDNYQARRFYEK